MGVYSILTLVLKYHWQAEDYLTIWNADKHINDPGVMEHMAVQIMEQLMDVVILLLICLDTSMQVLMNLEIKEVAGRCLT